MVKISRDNDMKKVVFFFGAGAEGTGNFNIRTGYDYLKSSLYASDALFGFNKALASFFEGKKYYNNKFVYRKVFNALNAEK